MLPFSINSLRTALLILILSVLFYFWDFTFNPIINIGLKSILVTAIYAYVVHKFQFSEDVTALINKVLKRK